MIAALKQESFDTQRAKGTCWAGTPAEIVEMIHDYAGTIPFEVASLQVNQHLMPLDAAERSVRLFADAVMPRCAGLGAAAVA